MVSGSTRGVTTDMDGTFTIEVLSTDKLVFSFLGMDDQTILVGDQTEISVKLKDKSDMLKEVTIVGFSTQKKESVISSISTIKPAELKVASSNLTTALAGKVAGLVSYQRSGEPGKDNAEFFVRGVTSFGYTASPLILIDGIELTAEDLARLQPDDIESFSILKDATSAAVYGSRGANGVILVTTKEGKEGKVSVTARFENSFSTPLNNISVADPLTYMLKHNEAVSTRDPLSPLPYSQEKIDNTMLGRNREVYPQTDWYNTLFNDLVANQRFNFNINGGGKVARYYIAATYNKENGAIKVNDKNNFNSNINIDKVSIRSNINIDMTKTTEVVLRMHGTFDEYTGPLDGGALAFQKAMRANPVLFPAYYTPDERNQSTNHILFGNTPIGNALNPYADLVKGYKNSSRTLLLVQGELKQNFDFITKGLKARALINTNRTSYFESSRSYNPYYYIVDKYDRSKEVITLENVNPKTATEFLNYNPGFQSVESSFYVEAALNYDRTFDDVHGVSGLLVYTMKDSKISTGKDLQASLPYRNLGLAGRFTYSYDSRYFFEGNFGYNGSERFSTKKRFGFFPSAGLAWLVSNEKFFEPLKDSFVNSLKLKATYGLVGNDAIGDANDRFFYLSNVNLNAGTAPGFGLDLNGPEHRPTVSISRYANENISWEIAEKMNLGIELGLFDCLTIQADYFKENRSNILMKRSSITPEMGLEADVQANIGEASSEGFDASIDYNKSFQNGWWVAGRANFTYAKGKYKVFEEPEYVDAPWLSHANQSIGQTWGYIAERLFVDDEEARNSPKQFGDYRGGDIKYKDINGDGVINFKDEVPIGHPTSPEIIYGLGFSTGYKNFDLSVFFQGSGSSSFWIDPVATAPFLDTDDDDNVASHNALLSVYANDHWSEKNQNPYALWPRLSGDAIENNQKKSTWFMQDGSFLRLKTAEFGYSLSERALKKTFLNKLRIYASGNNLLTFSKFKLWDPEMAGDGLGYPVQRVYNVGIQIGF